MKIYKIAKHVSDHSHSCLHCGGNLSPVGFSRNKRHHFPWGINYKCSCGKSGLWTNSIRGEKEFMEVVFRNSRDYLSGFCNDLYCPVCFSGVTQLAEIGIDDDNNLAFWCKEDDKNHIITNWDQFLQVYHIGKDYSRRYDVSYMGKEAGRIKGYYSIEGCNSVKHNTGIIWKGYESEYKESEYRPIYDWIRLNRDKIPNEMLEEMKSYI